MAKTPTFYPLFAQFSSLAPVVAGVYVKNFCANEGTDMETSMRRIAGAVGVCGLCMAALYRFYTTHLLETTPTKGGNSKPKGKPTKPEMSFAESARFLLRSEYLACIAVLVLSYGVAIQFSDIMWKSMVSRLYPEPLEYQRYFATFSSNVGVTTFLVIFVGSTLVKRVGWRAGALATPVTMGLLACPFFAMIVYSGQTIPKESLGLIVFFGALQGMLSKATKNAFFDPTVQMTYIPLDQASAACHSFINCFCPFPSLSHVRVLLRRSPRLKARQPSTCLGAASANRGARCCSRLSSFVSVPFRKRPQSSWRSSTR